MCPSFLLALTFGDDPGLLRLLAGEPSSCTASMLELDTSDELTLKGEFVEVSLLCNGEDGVVLRDDSLEGIDNFAGSPGFQFRYSFLICRRTFAM